MQTKCISVVDYKPLIEDYDINVALFSGEFISLRKRWTVSKESMK
jgi:hypothetical protein